MRKNVSLALVFLMLFGNISMGLVEEESQSVEQAVEIVYEVEANPAEPAEVLAENSNQAESPNVEPAEESHGQAAASASAMANSSGTIAGVHAEVVVQETVCICNKDLHCCDIIALFEAGELPEDTELCLACIIEVNGKLQWNEDLCECCKDYCKQKVEESTADSGENAATGTEAENDVSASSQTESSEEQADVSSASGESEEVAIETGAESSEETIEETVEESTKETTKETTEQSTANTTESTVGSTSAASETSRKKSNKAGGKRSSGTKPSSSSKGAGKAKVSAAAGAKEEAQGTEGGAGSITTWYRYQDFVDLDSLLFAIQAESDSSSLYIGKNFLLSNLQNTLLLSKDETLLQTLAGNVEGEIEGLLLENEGEDSSSIAVYVLVEEEGVELEHKFYTTQVIKGETIIEETLPEGTLAKILLAEDYLYLQNSEQVYAVAFTEEALASLQAQAGFEKAHFLLLEQEVLEGRKILQVQIASDEVSSKDTE